MLSRSSELFFLGSLPTMLLKVLPLLLLFPLLARIPLSADSEPSPCRVAGNGKQLKFETICCRIPTCRKNKSALVRLALCVITNQFRTTCFLLYTAPDLSSTNTVYSICSREVNRNSSIIQYSRSILVDLSLVYVTHWLTSPTKKRGKINNIIILEVNENKFHQQQKKRQRGSLPTR